VTSVEAVGELVDCLKTFGERETSPVIQRGITYLLAEQNADGSWGGEQVIFQFFFCKYELCPKFCEFAHWLFFLTL
jgi:hypothetical protein